MSSKIKISYGRNFLFLNFFYFFLIKKKRFEIYDLFIKKILPNKNDKLLDVGTTSSTESHENVLINKYPYKFKITCLSNQNLQKLKKKLKNIKIIFGDGRNMQFKNNSFDYVISTATIEHVGSNENQLRFLRECVRVAKKKVFVTTPNRFFPIDFHTRLPFIHWLPKKIHRKILTLLNENFLNKEENLNLLSTNTLKYLCNICNIRSYKVYKIKFLGLTSNLILIIDKNNVKRKN